ncbi:hypothetical protein B9G55_12045 [Saccharibacillus sp. O16]|nr:hypothetical protein B9G55_12045 [Saccharibacillus sp. O16]
MHLLRHELKKIWNWRVLALLAVLAALVWSLPLRESAAGYDSMRTHGGYGSYQRELFQRYGNTLEPEEWADYDVPGKIAAVQAETDALIAKSELFAKQGIHNYAQYLAFVDRDTSGLDDAELERFMKITQDMRDQLSLRYDGQTLDEFYASPQMRMMALKALASAYGNPDDEYRLQSFIQRDERPVVVQAAREILSRRNSSLIRVDLVESASMYAATVGVFSLVATLLLVTLPLSTDRTRQVHLMQYSSRTGRRILRIQGAAMLISSLIVSILSIALGAIPLLAEGAAEYRHASIQQCFSFFDMGLYDLTFGQYAMILCAMIMLLTVGTAAFVFILTRFSANLMTLLIKIVPLGLALSGIAVLTIYQAFSSNNLLFSAVLRGRIVMPEPLLCAIIAGAGLLGAWWVTCREKHVDVG